MFRLCVVINADVLLWRGAPRSQWQRGEQLAMQPAPDRTGRAKRRNLCKTTPAAEQGMELAPVGLSRSAKGFLRGALLS
jgi:hypothetical protein